MKERTQNESEVAPGVRVGVMEMETMPRLPVKSNRPRASLATGVKCNPLAWLEHCCGRGDRDCRSMTIWIALRNPESARKRRVGALFCMNLAGICAIWSCFAPIWRFGCGMPTREVKGLVDFDETGWGGDRLAWVSFQGGVCWRSWGLAWFVETNVDSSVRRPCCNGHCTTWSWL